MDFESLRGIDLFDGLDDTQLVDLIGAGEERFFAPGDELFHEGQPADVWWVLLKGTITLVRHVGREETAVGSMTTPGQWAGGFQAWDTHGIYFATGRAATWSSVFRVPAEALRSLADAWFPFGVHFITGLVNTVRRIESAARQREALVALGTLAAGLAHELNNPASAASRAVDALTDTSDALFASLSTLAQGSITADQFIALDALRRGIKPPSAELDAIALADHEEALSDWLTEHAVERDWVIAPPFAAAGVDVAFCERVAEVLKDGPLEAGYVWIASSLAMTGLLSEVKESTGRISSLIAAVKSYSQLDRASLQMTDVAEGIESTLVMLAHKLKDGVTVLRDYGRGVPPIEAVAGELNQVWTNLIDNAIDAMGGTGTLRVSTRVDEVGLVVIEITDTGPGMPPPVQARAFEPFYTTKDVGLGTGLGLDISRRIIVERHSGEISIDSRPGCTVLRVRLPQRRTANA